jgi:NADH dehydrogenase [ubiquinone] 1 alpha subcomplex assembly factor 5
MDLLFDRELLARNLSRSVKNFHEHNFLHHEIANRIAENVESLNREFGNVLEIGARDDYLSSLVTAEKKITTEDSEILSLKPNSFDLILSNLNLHFINQIPQFLLQIKEALNPDGIFIASFFGEENLRELAHVLHQSEIEIYGGISPRMPPTIDVKTAAALLQKAGFVDPISEFAKVEVSYSDPMKLLKDLKFMGQGNILTKRSRRFFTKKFLARILENYRKLYGAAEGMVTATFEIITITGWK